MAADAPWAGRRLHLVGLAGAGMSGYALVALALGARVSGSDRAESPYLEPLRAEGVEIHIGHDAAHVPQDAEVFFSTAIPADNPERLAAGERARPRAALLAEITALRRTIAVAGAHGKTTTTSMVAHALLACGLDPGYLIGGELAPRGETPTGGGGSGWWWRPTSPIAPSWPSTRRSRSSPTSSSTTMRPTAPTSSSRTRSASSCTPRPTR